MLWTAEVAVCESILRVEAACGVTWTLLKGGKGPFLGAIRISQRMQRMLCSFNFIDPRGPRPTTEYR